MSPTIPTPRASSSAFAASIVLRPEPSALLPLVWAAAHLVGLGGLLYASLPWALKALGSVLVAGHAVARYPRLAPPLVLRGDGRFDLLSTGQRSLELASGTRFTAYWIRLELTDGIDGRRFWLVFDQIDEPAWRSLQARLRRARVG